MKQHLIEWRYHPNLDLDKFLQRILDADFRIDHIIHTHYDENMVAICTLIIVTPKSHFPVKLAIEKIKTP